MRKRVVVTGAGCISPLGNDVESTWRGACEGRSGVGQITAYDTTNQPNRIAGEVKGFDAAALFGRKEARRMDRFTQFALAASAEAVRSAGPNFSAIDHSRVGVFLGTGIGGMGTFLQEAEVFRKEGPSRISPFLIPMMLTDSASGQVAIHFGARGPNMCIVSACATGSNAIGEAAEVIRRGSADAMITGGAEAAIIPLVIAGFGVMGALSHRNDDPTRASRPFDLHRDGFVPGEGAGILILEEFEHARARGAKILAELLGYGTTDDAFHISAPREDGSGAIACMRLALEQAGIPATSIGYINAHGTSTRLNDKSETIAIKQVFGDHARSLAVSSTKSMTGHLLGAAGGLEAIFTVLSIRDSIIPPTINYETPDPECDLDYTPNTARRTNVRAAASNSFGFGGHNATLIFGAPPSAA